MEVADFISGELDKVEAGKETDGDADSIVSKLDAFLEEVKSKSNGVTRESYIQEVSNQQYYIAPAKSSSFIDLESSVEEIEARVEKSKYIQVDITKMNQLAEILDALVLSQEDAFHKFDDMDEAVYQMKRLTMDLQDVVNSIRRVTLTNIFHRMNRIVFDASRKLGKDIELVMEGMCGL